MFRLSACLYTACVDIHMHVWPAVRVVAHLCTCMSVLDLKVAMLDPNRCRVQGTCAVSVVTGPGCVSSSGLSIHMLVPLGTAAVGVAVLACAVNSVQMLFG